MVTRLAALLLALIAAAPTIRAQDDEETLARQINTRWDEMVDVVRTARRELGELQLSYSGAEDPAARKKAAAEFKTTKEKVIAVSKAFLAEVDAFLQTYPENIPIRERRLTDSLFDAMDAKVKADDAKKLWELTSNNEYLHTAADHYDKAYDYASSAVLWETASESAPTEEVFESLGTAYMNIYEFAKAKAAFQRALDAATADRGKRVQGQNVKFAEEYIEGWKREQELRKADDNPIIELDTTRGKIVVELFEDEAPNTVASFVNLVEQKFYDGTPFFRCMAYFMVQGGCPEGTGRGGPGYALMDEHDLPGARMHFPGSLSTANQNQPNTNGSQFFITNTNTYQLNGRHTVFGRVLEGLDAVKVKPLDATNKAKPFVLKSAKVVRKRDHDYAFEKLPEKTQ